MSLSNSTVDTIYSTQLNNIQHSLSNSQKKLFSEISSLIGKEPSLGLISLQGVEKTSQAEIRVIAQIISQFNPINIIEYQETPRRIVLGGKYSNRYTIRIIPQYKVPNIKEKCQPWAIDLVLELILTIDSEATSVASIGIEYDGHPEHYIESKIKSTYIRDAHIVGETGITFIKISPEGWKKESETFIKAVRKYFARQVKNTENVISKISLDINQKVYQKNVNQPHHGFNYIKCPICDGLEFLVNKPCPVCSGYGRITQFELDKVDYSEYDSFTCPSCEYYHNNKRCHICGGKATISREAAIKLARNKQ